MNDPQDITPKKAERRVFLVDDHPMLRDGLKRLVEQIPGCVICGEAESAAGALEIMPRLKPDLAIIDISLPDRNGLELLKDMHSLMPDVRMLVFSMHDEILYAERVLKAGAQGYLMKGADTALVIDAVGRILDDGIYISPMVSNVLLRGISAGKTQKRGLNMLTDRELEIFEQIGRCMSSGQISDKLNISPKTVDAHRANIRVKLDLPDASSLLREAVLWVELATKPGGRLDSEVT